MALVTAKTVVTVVTVVTVITVETVVAVVTNKNYKQKSLYENNSFLNLVPKKVDEKIQIVTKLKNQNCDKTHNSNSDKTIKKKKRIVNKCKKSNG